MTRPMTCVTLSRSPATEMTIRIFASAVFAGLAAGLIAALLQFWLITPLILEGEKYETGELVHFGQPHTDSAAPSDAGHDHSPADEEDGLGRHLLTVAMNMVTWTGFALVLVALASLSGQRLSGSSGILWGLAGFAAIQLFPAMGLPPELPGTPAEDIVLRQYWWTGTVAASVAGLGLIFILRTPLSLALGALALALPHVIGAPELPYYGGIAPPELAALFVARSLGVGAVTWAILGFIAGWIWERDPLSRNTEALA